MQVVVHTPQSPQTVSASLPSFGKGRAALPAVTPRARFGEPAGPAGRRARHPADVSTMARSQLGRSLLDGGLTAGVTDRMVQLLPEALRSFQTPITITHLRGYFAGDTDTIDRGIIVIGSSPRADLTLLDDGVSDRHVTLEVVPGVTKARLVFSAAAGEILINGTLPPEPRKLTVQRHRLAFADGAREGRPTYVQTGYLAPRDVITIGSAIFRVEWTPSRLRATLSGR